MGRHLANEAARASAAAYLEALLGGATRKNGWQLAEAAGLATPYRFQHLLGRAVWEADAVRDDHLAHMLEALGQRDAVLAIDETGFVKQGKKSVGVARQYCGASGKAPGPERWVPPIGLEEKRGIEDAMSGGKAVIFCSDIQPQRIEVLCIFRRACNRQGS